MGGEEKYVLFADSLTRMTINSHTCHGAGSTIGGEVEEPAPIVCFRRCCLVNRRLVRPQRPLVSVSFYFAHREAQLHPCQTDIKVIESSH